MTDPTEADVRFVHDRVEAGLEAASCEGVHAIVIVRRTDGMSATGCANELPPGLAIEMLLYTIGELLFASDVSADEVREFGKVLNGMLGHVEAEKRAQA